MVRRKRRLCLLRTTVVLVLGMLTSSIFWAQTDELSYVPIVDRLRQHLGAQAPADAHLRPYNQPRFHPSLLSFWANFTHVLVGDGNPKCPNIAETGPGTGIEAPINVFQTLPSWFQMRPNMLKPPVEDVEKLKNAHTRFVGHLPELVEKMPYVNGTKGIVVTASGAFFPPLIVSLRMLRRTGSAMPVQVFVENRDAYERYMCREVLPALNAQCMVLSEVLNRAGVRLRPEKYQLKAFAMLFSTFDDVILMDADNILMELPENLLSTEPYTSTGFVSWPDYWANTASPLYYTISSQRTPHTGKRAASESGQLLISKSKQASTLLLSVYYNYYGPQYYYPLLSQGAVGQGDKETYLAAAMALNKTYYTVRAGPERLEFIDPDSGDQHLSGTLQFSALEDFNIRAARPSSSSVSDELISASQSRENHHTEPPLEQQHEPQQHLLHRKRSEANNAPPEPASPDSSSPSTTTANYPNTDTPALLRSVTFLHASTYKLNAPTFLATWRREIKTRMFGPPKKLRARFHGRDIEAEVWDEMRWSACTLKPYAFKAWKKERLPWGGNSVCRELERCYGKVFDRGL